MVVRAKMGSFTSLAAAPKLLPGEQVGGANARACHLVGVLVSLPSILA